MTRLRLTLSFAGLLIFGAGLIASRAATTNEAADFKEVYSLIREHLAGANDMTLNQTAVESLIAALRPKVALVHGRTTNAASAEWSSINKTSVFERDIAYVQIVAVGHDLPERVSQAYQQLNSTNKIKGIVLDLRYADGADYEAAAATADLFLSKAEPLFSGGNGTVSSHEKSNAIKLPVAVLVNRNTSRAAEVLAVVLRETGTGLILGSRTAGDAALAQDFPLSNGDILRIATSSITLADGSKLSMDGIKPDIDVPVSSADERAYYADAFLVFPRTNLIASSGGNTITQSSRSIRYTEADLVRDHKAGLDPDRPFPTESGLGTRPSKPEAPVVSDPTLARALDLLKGLAVVRKEHF